MRIALVVACLALPAFSAASAHAAFPGANGKIAFHSSRDGNYEIYAMNSDGTGQTNLTNNGAFDASPAWSPDGTKIAFTSSRDGNNEIYSMNADGTGQTRLTNSSTDDVTPAWSPDGTKIVFTTNRDGNYEIYSMNSNGTSATRLTNNGALETQPSWSPKGDKIAFITNRNGTFDVWTMNTDGSSQTNFSDVGLGDNETQPDWSPDGKIIIFEHKASDRTQTDLLWYRTAGGGGSFTGSVSNNDNEPAWSPAKGDSSDATIAYAEGPSGGDFEIYTIGPQEQNRTPLTNNAADDRSPDWQPVNRNYARPRSATPIRLALVPAYKQCTVPNTNHKGALTTASCNPPKPESSYLTVGTPDFNGQAANAAGYVEMKAFCNGGASGEAPPCSTTAGDQEDISVTVSQTDVRCQGTSGSCPNGALSDYFGNLRLEVLARVTDRNSGGASGAATLQDVPLGFNFSCVSTGATTIGSACTATTSFDAILGGASVITEQKRAIWELDDIKIYDGGADGVSSTTGDNTLFAVDGLFAP